VFQIAVCVEGFSMIGTRMSHDRITEKLGAGGMADLQANRTGQRNGLKTAKRN
jgi:hypothetical protein